MGCKVCQAEKGHKEGCPILKRQKALAEMSRRDKGTFQDVTGTVKQGQ